MNSLYAALLTTALLGHPSLGQSAPAVPDGQRSFWAYDHSDREPASSDILLPLGSLLIPGLGQWVRMQFGSASAYSLTAIGGSIYASNASYDIHCGECADTDINSKDVATRKQMLGLQVYQASGGLSLYHSFRSAAWQRQQYGQYAFLGDGETPAEILASPFRFEYVQRPSTYIPLAIGFAASWYLATHPVEGFKRVDLRREDPWFASAFSYGAGTHEEAVFRGWAMPILYEAGFGAEVSNLGQSLLFALAHLGTNDRPWPQFFLGLHLGRVSQKNHWTLGESIFIHTWWDVAAFLSAYHLEKNQSDQQAAGVSKSTARRSPLKLFLPPLIVNF